MIEVNENSQIQRIENTREAKCSNCCKTAKIVGMIATILLTSVGVLGSIFFLNSNKFTDILKNLALRITRKNISDALAFRIRMISTFAILLFIVVLGIYCSIGRKLFCWIVCIF